MTTKAASAMAHMRWDRIPKAERSQHVPHTGGVRLYPKCPLYRSHRWYKGRCKCGYAKP